MPNTEREPEVGDHYRRTHYGKPFGATWVLTEVSPWYNASDGPYSALVNTQTGASELIENENDLDNFIRVPRTERDELEILADDAFRTTHNILDKFDDVDPS